VHGVTASASSARLIRRVTLLLPLARLLRVCSAFIVHGVTALLLARLFSFSMFVPFQPFETGLMTAPCSFLLQPFTSQRFVATYT
jgi:hypothetical protein